MAAKGTACHPGEHVWPFRMWAWPPRAPPFVLMRPDSLVMAAFTGFLRKRNVGGAEHSPASPSSLARDSADSPAPLLTGTFWLTRVVLLRALAFIYCECPVSFTGSGLSPASCDLVPNPARLWTPCPSVSFQTPSPHLPRSGCLNLMSGPSACSQDSTPIPASLHSPTWHV